MLQQSEFIVRQMILIGAHEVTLIIIVLGKYVIVIDEVWGHVSRQRVNYV